MKNQKLRFIATKGLSFSGKSTFALEKAKELGNCVIITKDDIRKEMGADLIKGIRVKEGRVIEKRNELIMKALEKGQNIISADTNFSSKGVDHIKNMKALVFPKYRDQYDFEVKDFTDIPFDVILERAKKTDRPEGPEYWIRVVREQKDKYITPPDIVQDETLPKCVILDHDGTLCHVSPNRSPYDGTHSHEDTKNEIVCEYASFLKQMGYTIFIFSGLEDKYRTQRENWLSANGVKYDYLYMRTTGDHRKDFIIKQELYEEHIKDKYFVHVIVDDRPMMQRHWIDKGFSKRLFSVGNPFKEF